MTAARLAFYAPLKAPTHPVASGDRTIARLLLKALRGAGYAVETPTAFRSYEGRGETSEQVDLRKAGRAEARKLIRHYVQLPRHRRPHAWFTYHLYHKAPDWIGPMVARALRIPYVLAEASYADKQRQGNWAAGLASTRHAIRCADAIFTLNPRDRDALVALRGGERGVVSIQPFLDTTPFEGPRMAQRSGLAIRHGVEPGVPWLISVGMVRRGDKLASFAMQAEVLARLQHYQWHWLIVGDGVASADLDALLEPLQGRVSRLGALDTPELAVWLRNADLTVWPAINEAIGMALLEAQAAGLPVLAGRTDGVAAICQNAGCTLAEQNSDDLTAALASLLQSPEDLARRGEIARRSVSGVDDAGLALRAVLEPLIA